MCGREPQNCSGLLSRRLDLLDDPERAAEGACRMVVKGSAQGRLGGHHYSFDTAESVLIRGFSAGWERGFVVVVVVRARVKTYYDLCS
jgi:hypothetical protein